jgi:SAM-dependent methyltransferase
MISRLIDLIRLRKLKKKTSAEYSQYLDVQFKRSRSKFVQGCDRERNRKEELMGIVADHVDLSVINSALVIGCRNSYELDLLESRGIRKTVGVDLFSHDKRIRVMDMHKLEFNDAIFGLIYCSHALEHAINPVQVCGEMVRVVRDGGIIVIEVPVNYETRGSDIQDYGSPDNLASLFGRFGTTEVVFKEHVAKENNSSGTDVARLIIRLSKK